MKIKKLKLNQKLLELYLIKLRTYEQYNLKIKNSINVDISHTLRHFKKALKILFKFHAKNKRILFLGLSGLILRKINEKTIHSAIPTKIKLQGILSFNKIKLENNIKYSLFKLKKKPELIIILDKIENHSSFLNESINAKIPTITFNGQQLNSEKRASLYNIPVTSEFLLNNKNFFHNCLKFLFKKPKILLKKHKKYDKKKV